MKTFVVLVIAVVARFSPWATAADLEFTETLQLPEGHSLGWVRANAGVKGQGARMSFSTKRNGARPRRGGSSSSIGIGS